MTTLPSYYSLEVDASAPSAHQPEDHPRWSVVLGVAAGVATFCGYSVWAGAHPNEQRHTVPSIRMAWPGAVSRMAGLPTPRRTGPLNTVQTKADEGIDVEVAEEGIAQEWPPHYVQPKSLKHPTKKVHKEDEGIDVEVAEEGIGREWPPHYPQPKSLAHPQHKEKKVDEGIDMEVAEEGIAKEWPAHYIEPKSLKHPTHKAPKADEGIDAEVAGEGIAQEWPPHYFAPEKLGH